jgi:hypothetical protein
MLIDSLDAPALRGERAARLRRDAG